METCSLLAEYCLERHFQFSTNSPGYDQKPGHISRRWDYEDSDKHPCISTTKAITQLYKTNVMSSFESFGLNEACRRVQKAGDKLADSETLLPSMSSFREMILKAGYAIPGNPHRFPSPSSGGLPSGDQEHIMTYSEKNRRNTDISLSKSCQVFLFPLLYADW
jgi:hypothetical protein